MPAQLQEPQRAEACRALDPRTEVLALARQHADPVALLHCVDDHATDDVIRELIRLGCERAIDLARAEAEVEPERKPRRARTQVVTAYSAPASAGHGMAARMRALEPAYDWTLPNGAQLGMANVADLDNAIAAHTVKTKAHMGWIKFYGAVKARLVKAKAATVADILSTPELLQLKTASGATDEN